MKKLKKVLTCLLAGFMVVCSCVFFTACDDEPEKQTPTAPPTEETAEPEVETPVPVKLSAQEAEVAYYDALLNSLKQTQRHEECKAFGRTDSIGFDEGIETTVVLKDGVACIKNYGQYTWFKEGKRYVETTKKYYTAEPIDTHKDALELLQLQVEADTRKVTFLSGEKNGAECRVSVKLWYSYGGEENEMIINVKIKNNLIYYCTMAHYSHAELSYGDGFMEVTITYENVNFPKAIPTDFDTYTLGD